MVGYLLLLFSLFIIEHICRIQGILLRPTIISHIIVNILSNILWCCGYVLAKFSFFVQKVNFRIFFNIINTLNTLKILFIDPILNLQVFNITEIKNTLSGIGALFCDYLNILYSFKNAYMSYQLQCENPLLSLIVTIVIISILIFLITSLLKINHHRKLSYIIFVNTFLILIALIINNNDIVNKMTHDKTIGMLVIIYAIDIVFLCLSACDIFNL